MVQLQPQLNKIMFLHIMSQVNKNHKVMHHFDGRRTSIYAKLDFKYGRPSIRMRLCGASCALITGKPIGK